MASIRGLEDESGVDVVHVVGAVDQETVRLRTLAIDRVALTVAQSAARLQKTGCQGYDPRLQEHRVVRSRGLSSGRSRISLFHRQSCRGCSQCSGMSAALALTSTCCRFRADAGDALDRWALSFTSREIPALHGYF